MTAGKRTLTDKEVEVFDPATRRFATVSGQMNDRWHYMSETRLRDGSVLLAGGYPNSDQATPRLGFSDFSRRSVNP
jgi:hypothetical protein